MANANKFTITYEVDDGYAGPARPQYTYINADDLKGDESEEDLRNMFHEEIQRHYLENCCPSPKDDCEQEFIAWAHGLRGASNGQS